jgi:predicted nucleic acid-binding protein
MTPLFADTSLYVAALNPRDGLHDRAKAAAATRGRIVTTDFVLAEVANFFCKSGQRPLFVALAINLREAEDVEIVPATREWWDRGFDLFTARPDKEWSLVDCISFAVMTEYKLTDALTADHHFAQAGFVPLLV